MNQELELIAARIVRLRRQAESISNTLNELTADLINLDRMTDFTLRRKFVGQTFEAVAIGTICDFYRVEVPLLISKDRTTRVTKARQVICYLLREHGKMTFEGIGCILERNHSTVVHSHNLIAARMAREPGFAKTIMSLLATIKTRVKELPLKAVEAQENYVEPTHDSEGTDPVSTDIQINHLQVAAEATDAGIQDRHRLALRSGFNRPLETQL